MLESVVFLVQANVQRTAEKTVGCRDVPKPGFELQMPQLERPNTTLSQQIAQFSVLCLNPLDAV
jgi:hypothetical protein